MKKLMKKLSYVMILILIPVWLFAAEPPLSTGSGEQTADALIYTGRCALASILIITDGSNNAKVVIYDGTTASGTVIYETTVLSTDHYGGRNWTFPVQVAQGIYVDVTGTGASYIVEYIQR